MSEKLYFTYDEIHKEIAKLAKDLTEFEPDLIVAIGGGGLIPSRILRSFLKIPIFVVTLESYADSKETSGKINVHQWLDRPEVIKSKRVLIVDELNDTGTTLAFCIDKLNELEPSDIAVAVIHWKEKKKVYELDVPCYVGKYVPDKWIVYPWELK